MIALGIRYLTRRCYSADSSRRAPEWPPHPGRVFMAMAAAHFEAAEPDPAERAALEWLESQPPPAIRSVSKDTTRSFVETYVPANDKLSNPVSRLKNARGFPSLYVGDDRVVLQWESEPATGMREALAGLCARVTRIGHSASVVQMWLDDDTASDHEAWQPSGMTSGGKSMRVPAQGTLAQLTSTFNTGTRPHLTNWRPYKRPVRAESQAALTGPFDPDFIVFSLLEGDRLGLESTLQLTGALRNAAMNAGPQPPPEWLSGHQADGRPSQAAHAAFFPLPFVVGQYPDGHVMGLGMAIPKEVGEESLRLVLPKLLFGESGEDRDIRLWQNHLPNGWRWRLRRETSCFPRIALRHSSWIGPSHRWASVTPVVLHHYPKSKRAGDIERIVLEAFRSALTDAAEEIEDVHTSPVSHFPAAGHARSLPPYQEGGTTLCKYQVHVSVRFRQPVQGPLLIGRGRFRGYGLLKPIVEER